MGELERPEMEAAVGEGVSGGARERGPTTPATFSSAARLPVVWRLRPPEAIFAGGGGQGSCGTRGACPLSWFPFLVSFLAEQPFAHSLEARASCDFWRRQFVPVI
jgi:hypothetical protein